MLERADRLVVHDEVGLGAQLLGAAAHLAGHAPHGLDRLDAAGRHHEGLGRRLDHGAELTGIGLARLHAVGVGARHDEVDVGQRVAQPGRHRDVGQRRQAALSGLEVEEVHEVGAVAEIRVAAAHLHGRLAGAVVDREAGRRRLAGPGHERGRHVHETGVVARAAAGQHDRLALLVKNDHADLGQDAESGVVDLLLLLVAQKGDAAGAGLLGCL